MFQFGSNLGAESELLQFATLVDTFLSIICGIFATIVSILTIAFNETQGFCSAGTKMYQISINLEQFTESLYRVALQSRFTESLYRVALQSRFTESLYRVALQRKDFSYRTTDFSEVRPILLNYCAVSGIRTIVHLTIFRPTSVRKLIGQLQNEEEPGENAQASADAPPPYSSIAGESSGLFDYKDELGFPKPPSYNVATTLPSYDEAERSKAEATIPLVPGRDDDFVARDDFDDADQLRIGNDGIFMLTFFMAFLFNWIGFFLSFCLTSSAAGRYGAISGFGLSLIKWILIVRFSTYFPGYFDGQYWLWWVFLVLGFLLFLRGFINYAKVRKMPDNFSTLPRTRVLFIY
ncbi:hypothetical protein XELAEV_18017175mg [Xenopus laevis]|uniref:NEDD4 family-interacting protein 1 n=1 Tax=Xenopus laevis TaxID=8355 RepID=A0A974HSS2_XENLA|nr:hypothetical protein XELAEV_18017175mg [Xenopus laevis]